MEAPGFVKVAGFLCDKCYNFTENRVKAQRKVSSKEQNGFQISIKQYIIGTQLKKILARIFKF